jgi:hypothetical protein
MTTAKKLGGSEAFYMLCPGTAGATVVLEALLIESHERHRTRV